MFGTKAGIALMILKMNYFFKEMLTTNIIKRTMHTLSFILNNVILWYQNVQTKQKLTNGCLVKL